jgi:hypothetical protein
VSNDFLTTEHATADGMMENSKAVDHPSQETIDLRQGTGPRATVSVLIISLALAAFAAGGLAAYAFFLR